ncbi:MAG: adenylate/guanylate cyclase domain-containing protein [Acidobacteriota bacterium]|nr:adenylate/guanylate cyclase domain-containing protein [Acidobacteriota bacterium]
MKKPESNKSQADSGLFAKERNVLKRAEAFLNAEQHDLQDALVELKTLTRDYKRLLRQTRNLTRVSDRSQHKLHTLGNELDYQLGRHVGKEIKDDIMRGWGTTEVRSQYLTVIFVDIRGFTSFAENRKPAEVIAFLKAYYEYSLEIVHKYGGLVKSFMGDGVMLVFGYNQDDHTSDNAIRCSLEILERLPEFNKSQGTNLRLGIGLHSGPAAVGTIGTRERSEFAVIGNTVNMASRIESETKYNKVPLLFTNEVREILRESPREPVFIKTITLRGQVGTVDLYSLEGLV